MQNSDKTKKPLEVIPFVLRYSLKERLAKFAKQKSEQVNELFRKPDFIPLIIQKHPKSKLPYIDKTRFVCEKSNKFLLVKKMIENKVQKAVQGDQKKKQGKLSFFLYINNQMPKPDQQMQEIYQKYKAEDGFVYIQYGQMETFGGQQDREYN